MASPEYRVIGASLSEPHTSKSFIRLSFYEYRWQKTNTKPYKFLCDTKVLYSILIMPYMAAIGLSVSWKVCDKVFPDSHIWLLYCQCHEMHVTKFSWMAIYGHWIIDIAEVCDKVLLKEMATAVAAVWSSLAWKLYDATFVKLQGDMHAIGWIAQGLNNYCLGAIKNIKNG